MKEKELTLDINGKDYKVSIIRFTADEAEVRVNGENYVVGLKDLGIEQVADIKPQPGPAPETATETQPPAGAAFPGRKKSASPVHRPKTLQNQNAITAPLPGLITKIFIKDGDVIKAGQPIIMLEAMKMENEVNATSAGIVLDIRFKEGDSVNQGDVLVLIKPAEA